MGFFMFKKKKEEEVYIPPVDTKLYILTEIQKRGLVDYLKQYNVEVCFISSSCDSLLTALVSEEDNCRVLIIDSGFGRFEEKKTMEDISAIVELAMDVGSATLFTSNSVLGNMRRQLAHKNKEVELKFELVKKTGTVDILKTLQGYNEVYTKGGAKDVPLEDILSFQGRKINVEHVVVDTPLDLETVLDTSNKDDSLDRYGNKWK